MSRRLNVAVLGAGRVGQTRAGACANSGFVGDLWVVDRDPVAAEKLAMSCGASGWATSHEDLPNDNLDIAMVCTAPESTHYPITRDYLSQGKHVLVEKPMALTIGEADDLLAVAAERKVSLSIGFSQRFNPKYVYIKQAFEEGLLGRPVTALFSRHVERGISGSIADRGNLGPAEISTPHAVDLLLWWMADSTPVRVYAQASRGVLEEHGVPDALWMLVTMSSGATFTVGCNWNLPTESPRFSSNFVEVVGTDGVVTADETRRDLMITTVGEGLRRPLATMPGEMVRHVYQGPMEAETLSFVGAIAHGTDPVVTGLDGRRVMEVALAADLSARTGHVVELPLSGTHTG